MATTLHKMAALMIACAAIAGCRETMHCEPGRSYQNGECRPYGDASGIDAGPSDTGIVDMGTDTNPDANPCNACSTGRVCLLDGRHDAAAPDAGMGACVECASDSDCDARMIDGGTFGDGGALPGRAICQDYACVFGCRDSGDCGGNPCLATGRCSEYPTYTSTNVPCAPCDTDANCNGVTDYVCVGFHYQNGAFTHDGNYCLRHATACGALTTPLATPLSPAPATSIGGLDIHDGVCGPTTSCEALLDASGPTACTLDSGCGLTGTDDGVCVSATHCSLLCNNANDCPRPAYTHCLGAPAVCTP